MVARASLALAGAAIAVWLLVTLHWVNLESHAQGLLKAHPSASALARIQGLLHDAEGGNPDPQPQLEEALALGLAGRNRDAAALCRSLLRDEPDNLRVAIVLYANLRRYDTRGAAAAARRIRAIAPPVTP